MMGLDSNPTTTNITKWAKNQPILVLLDSRATHNFINPRVVERLGFKRQTLQRPQGLEWLMKKLYFILL